MTIPTQAPDQFAEPGLGSGGVRPSLASMRHRTLIISPIRLERNVPVAQEPGKFQDRLTADVIICDGGPLSFGGNPARFQPDTQTVSTPYRASEMYISSSPLVRELAPLVPGPANGGRGGVLVARLVQGAAKAANNPPWLLDRLTRSYPAQDDPKAAQILAALEATRQRLGLPDVATLLQVNSQAYALAMQIWQAVMQGVFVNPTPVALAAPGGYPTQQPAPAYPQPGAFPTSTYAQAPAQPAPPQFAPPVQPAPAQYPPQFAPPAPPTAAPFITPAPAPQPWQPAPVAQAPADDPHRPATIPAEVWSSWDETQRTMVLSSLQAAAQAPAAPPAGPPPASGTPNAF